ncbi:TIGR03086 family metal-binding protein [Solicola gregarius]|uniref:TIGR03086 family metal-binding protein n=1 Tax=Solicola gregarius TaxID=2908642 RepID=A0AA46TF48_9ACTN|nr:TIGR03086 family metal-binding protein [Solicola gregarius]UYM04090.1 TIGR03086 family metal-binding protein [Solicola gregarius]
MNTDPRGTLRDAVDQAGALVAATTDDALARSTPCDEFDVRALLNHMDGVLRRIAHVLDGGAPFDVPSSVDGFADDDRDTVWKDDAATLGQRLDDDSVLDRMVTVPFGTMPGRAAIAVYVNELTTHAWDLASAIGRPDLLEDALATYALEVIQDALPEEPRGGPIPFGPVVAVGPDAAAYERLAGWLGRDPAWRA